ncbi:3-deoxy-D-manno-oct-2-ulosonic acid (Kdo) hydroxylase [Nitrosospira sp. Nsp11]|uniref:Kdo hydroxylase family protein n=1 Tax=Nitrosospira sp. Nsp11 TaxID=1855338 RepID=UPI00088EB81D|nr:Kdo hydroxylase family protein [Nitrosospira sp. Nsp11]SDA21521.1 3-deoxy-D-manno-oct-2-ulosonic acid (Kdo) hydroxylase [Nitrosospira sp. Nsp18]SHL19671.1 3-deoxy-D-manno-oct-2-ulosonic acid (Kdo) hydroxylase [Nitrosospira sp. Nsp11]
MVNEEHVSVCEAETVKMLTIEPGADLSTPEMRRTAIETLEGGGVIYLPRSGFELTEQERDLISDTAKILTQEPDVQDGRPTIIFDPARGSIKKYHYARVRGKMMRAKVRDTARPDLEAAMARYGKWTESVIGQLFPSYQGTLDRKRVTYRPFQRSNIQALHIDSSYGYPTQGRGMLRIFSNIHPTTRPRIWQLGEPFEPFVRRFLPSVRLKEPSLISSILARLGIVDGTKTKYDQYIAALRALGMSDKEYQQTAPHKFMEFPPGSSWIAITDLVLHGAVSGQHSFDQTFYLPVDAMNDPSRSSLRILERLTGEALV